MQICPSFNKSLKKNLHKIVDITPKNSDVYFARKKAQEYLLDKNLRPRNYTKNEFEVQKDGKVIYDHLTGLMWQQSGSEKLMTYDEACNYIRQINLEGFAGYNDWRLPTLEEAITLLEPKKKDNGMFIDPVFDCRQVFIWASDLSGRSQCHWCIIFDFGYCDVCFGDIYVRAVR